MEKSKLIDLIQKVLRGKATRSDKESLESVWQQMWNDKSVLDEMTLQEKEQLRQEIFSKIDPKTKVQRQEHNISTRNAYFSTSGFSIFKIAAALVILTISAGLLYFLILKENRSTHQTAYGETRNVTLPDQSQVTLNGNSTISYLTHWDDKQVREVWISGEAFFDVVHTHDHKQFIVHISDDFAIEVLGTTFNVNARPTRTRVVLNSGKIKLNIKDEQTGEDLVMVPGELVEFENDPHLYKLEKVKPEVFSAWKNNKLIFDNTPISEICLLIKETYGMEVKVKNESLMDHKVSGSVPNNNLQNLLFGLSESLDLEVKIEDDHIIINSN